jgi:hypothetical protein
MQVDLPLVTAVRVRNGLAVEMISRQTVGEAWQALEERMPT